MEYFVTFITISKIHILPFLYVHPSVLFLEILPIVDKTF